MIIGLALKRLGFPFRLIFTSEAQRHHTWITRFLIARMDAVIATSEAAASHLKRPATVIPHGVDTQVYSPPADRAGAFAEPACPDGAASARSGAFGRKRAPTCSSPPCAGCCRVIRTAPRW